MNHTFLALFFLLFSLIAVGVQEIFEGISASDSFFNNRPIPAKVLCHDGNSFVTFSKYGFDTTQDDNSWLLQEYFAFAHAKDSAHTVAIDIGAGYGFLIKRYLETTTKSRIIMNDLSQEQVLIAREMISSSEWTRLWFNVQVFPRIRIADESIDMILLHRVLHFLSGKEIEQGLENSYRWLKVGGRIFIAVASPYNNDYAEWYFPEYQRNYEAGMSWPGEGLLVARAFPTQTYALPDRMHVMEEKALVTALGKVGFKVLKVEFISMKRFQTTILRDGREVIGVIAEK